MTAAPPWYERRPVQLAGLGTAAVLYMLSLDAYYVGFFNDDAFYIIGARSLLTGRYAELNDPAAPPLVHYLPGYPLLLAPLVALFPHSFRPLQLLSASLLVGAWALLSKVFQPLSARVRAAALALCALSPLTVSLSGAVLSDIPYLFLTAAILLLARAWWPSDDGRRWAALALAASAGFYLRPSGAAMPLALVGALAWERRWRPAGICAAVALAASAAWPARNWLVGAQGLHYAAELAAPYRNETLSALGQTLAANLAYYPRELFTRALWRLPEGSLLSCLAAAAWTCLAALGAWRGRMALRPFVLLYLALYAAAHLLWSKRAGRYLLPVLPLACALALEGLERLEERWKLRRLVPAAALLGLVLAARPVSGILLASRQGGRPANTPPRRALGWIRANTGPRDLFAAELDGQLHLLSGRPAVKLPRARDAADLEAWARARGVRYALALPSGSIMRTTRGGSPHDPLEAGRLEALLEASGAFQRVFSDPMEGSAVFLFSPKKKGAPHAFRGAPSLPGSAQ